MATSNLPYEFHTSHQHITLFYLENKHLYPLKKGVDRVFQSIQFLNRIAKATWAKLNLFVFL